MRPRHPLPAALAVGAAGAVGLAGRLALTRSASAVRARSDPGLDPLYELPGDVVHHEIAAADGGSVHLVERGAGRPLLLIHGITLQARAWAPQFHLMADRYRVMALDVRGHGRSVGGRDGLGRVAAARDVATVLDHFDLRHAVVVGHSMGGMILMEFAGSHRRELSERVDGLVFMNTAAYQVAPEPLRPAVRAVGRWAQGRQDAGRPLPERPLGDGDLSWVVTRLAFGARPSARAVDEVRRSGAEAPQSTVLACGVDLLDHDARRTLPLVRTPSLVLVGSRDLLTPVFAARRIARLLPDARLEVLAGAGHQLMQERPNELAAILDGFTSTLPSA
ncbi:MAG: alpha/beta hydrolase [Acidobacteriota bacterium]|nr:alpha/beta hydrolase [Acidobacteriota bacterium]